MATRTYQHGCLTVVIGRVGGMEASATRISDFTVTIGLVCPTNLGTQGIIWASDGKLITLEGGYLIGA